MPGRADQRLVDINAMALNAAISGSILADPEACFVMIMALPFGSGAQLQPSSGERGVPYNSKSPSRIRMSIARNADEPLTVSFDFSLVFQLRDTRS